MTLMFSVFHAQCRKYAPYVECHLAKCHYVECHYAEGRNAEYYYAECRGA
jgi:hypothetical protein